MNPALEMPEEGMTLDELSNFIGDQLKRANLVLKNIDGLNIVDIKFELEGGAYIQLNRKGLRFFDGKDFTLLTDINGNVTLKGTIAASTIIGSDIKTAEDGTYPRIDLSSTGNLLKASLNENNFISIDPDATGSPTLIFQTPNSEGIITPINSISTLAFNATKGKLSINAQTDDLMLLSGNNTRLTCNKLIMNGETGYSGSFSIGTQLVTVENGIIVDVS